MRSTFSIYFSFLSLSCLTTDALRLPFQRRAPRGISLHSPYRSSRYSFSQASESPASTVGDVNDIRYVTNITINGVDVEVTLDTGSTDLWVIPPGGIGKFNDTGIKVDLFFGSGGVVGASGTIGVAPFEFGSYKIEKQAFMNAVQSNITGLQELGIFGLMGLSFDFVTASPINQKIKSLYGFDATWGQSVLQNIFQQNPAEPNFIAIDLSRTGDLEDTDGGSFTIGEILSKFASVTDQPKLPQHPRGGDRWTTLLEGVYVEGKAIDVTSTIPGIPSGQSQTLLDTGNPTADLPVTMFDAIYSNIPGSALIDASDARLWAIPCNTTTLVEIVFAGQRYPIHPLDLSTFSAPLTIDGQQFISCLSAFTGTDGLGAVGFDVALGDSFLRNVYSVFDFGDTAPDSSTKDPYMQLLSKIDPAKAINEVTTIRGKTMATLPPEIDPAALVQFLIAEATGSGNSTSTTAASAHGPNPTSPSATSSTDEGSTKPKPKSDVDLALGDNEQTVTVDSFTLKKYGLIAIALLGGNLFVGLVLILLTVLACVRRGSSRKSSSATRASAPIYVPVTSVDRDEGYSDVYQKPYSQ